MPQLNFAVPQSLLDRVDAQKPDFLDRKSFLCLLIAQSLDMDLTGVLKVPAYCVGAGTSRNLTTEAMLANEAGLEDSKVQASFGFQLSNPSHTSRKAKPLRSADLGDGVGRESEGTPREGGIPKAPKTGIKQTKGTPEFEAFWKVYQSCPSKANCQSKIRAWEAWQEVVTFEDPARLISAAQKAVDQCHDLQRRGEFCAPLPDCFRWLRDERYAVLLEDHAPASPAKPSWML